MRCSTLRTSPMVRTSQGGRWCPMWNPPPGSHGPWLLGSHLATIWPRWWKPSIAIGWPMKKHCTRKIPLEFSLMIPSNPMELWLDYLQTGWSFHNSSHTLPTECPTISSSVSAPSHQPWAFSTRWPSRDQRIRIPQRVVIWGLPQELDGLTWKIPFKNKHDENEWWISACSCNSKLMFHVIV